MNEVFQQKRSWRRYFASHAISGLLANGRLDRSLTADNKVSPEAAKQLAKLALDIADAMIETAAETESKPTVG